MMTIDELMIGLRSMGAKCIAFFFNVGIKEWQFSIREGGGTGDYSYGYGATPYEAAKQCYDNLVAGTQNRKMKVDAPKPEPVKAISAADLL